MKRIAAILLAVLMVLSLAACAGETGTSGGAEPPQNSTAAPQTPDESQTPSEAGNGSQQPSETPDTPSEDVPSEPNQEPEGGKILVAYFSTTSGSTWLDGHRFSAGASAEDVMAWANGLGIN